MSLLFHSLSKLTHSHRKNVVFTAILFCEMSLHLGGSKSQLVKLVTSLDFTFPWICRKKFLITNAINTDAVIIIIIILIFKLL